MECLVRAWQPPVTNAGFLITRPTVTIYGESITTKCGDSGINAFYCSGRSADLLQHRTTPGRSLAWRASGPRTW